MPKLIFTFLVVAVDTKTAGQPDNLIDCGVYNGDSFTKLTVKLVLNR